MSKFVRIIPSSRELVSPRRIRPSGWVENEKSPGNGSERVSLPKRANNQHASRGRVQLRLGFVYRANLFYCRISTPYTLTMDNVKHAFHDSELYTWFDGGKCRQCKSKKKLGERRATERFASLTAPSASDRDGLHFPLTLITFTESHIPLLIHPVLSTYCLTPHICCLYTEIVTKHSPISPRSYSTSLIGKQEP